MLECFKEVVILSNIYSSLLMKSEKTCIGHCCMTGIVQLVHYESVYIIIMPV